MKKLMEISFLFGASVAQGAEVRHGFAPPTESAFELAALRGFDHCERSWPVLEYLSVTGPTVG